MTGPAYARHLLRRAMDAGVGLRLSTTATTVDDDGSVTLTGPGGIEVVRPDAVLLATGARERPRAARLVPGDRPAGVFTTGQLQQWVDLERLPVGRRAVVVGAEHVAYSAVLTLRRAGVETVAMTTSLPRHQTVAVFASATRLGLRVPLRTSTRVAGLHGNGRLDGVDVQSLLTGRVERLAADTAVFTGDWVPDHGLARRSGLSVDRPGLGPRTDGWGRTSRPGVRAAGNLVHPGETAGLAALGGRHAGRRLAEDLTRQDGARVASGLEVLVRAPLVSVTPVLVDPADPPRRLRLRTSAFTGNTLVVARQKGRPIGRRTLRHSVPNRSLGVPGSLLAGADPEGGAVELWLE
jgi:NADPH-dependent 2,4-dienoyl-CoA reductase/sulfur reductase-like enzyme